LPGHSVKYPEHEIRACYIELMRRAGISDETFKHKVKDYCLPGGYRKLIERPTALEWSILRYDDPIARLLLTDKDFLEEKTETETVADGKFKAVRVQFTLHASTYATICLRELMKQSTDAAFQRSLAQKGLERD